MLEKMIEGVEKPTEQAEKPIELKHDKYRNARGGEAHLFEINCTKCNSLLIKYQKDGIGNLLRCYLNRIVYPAEMERLQHCFDKSNMNRLPMFVCKNCKNIIGTPMFYMDGRVAYRLRKGAYSKKRIF